MDRFNKLVTKVLFESKILKKEISGFLVTQAGREYLVLTYFLNDANVATLGFRVEDGKVVKFPVTVQVKSKIAPLPLQEDVKIKATLTQYAFTVDPLSFKGHGANNPKVIYALKQRE